MVQLRFRDGSVITHDVEYITILQPAFVTGAPWQETLPPPEHPDNESPERDIPRNETPDEGSLDLPPLPPDAEQTLFDQVSGVINSYALTPEEVLDEGIEQIIQERHQWRERTGISEPRPLRHETRTISAAALLSPFSETITTSYSTTVQPSTSGQEELLDSEIQQQLTHFRQRPQTTPPDQHTTLTTPPRPTRPLPLPPTVVYPNRQYSRSRPSLDTIHHSLAIQTTRTEEASRPTPESLTEQLVREIFDTPTPIPTLPSRIRRGLSSRLHRFRRSNQSG